MRFGIIGTGSMGGLFAGFLAANGEDVCCFDVDGAIVDAIRDRGLHVERPGRDDLVVHPEASTDAGALGPVDVAFLFAKTIDSDAALRDGEPMIGPETRVVTVQNGLRNVDRVERHVPADRVLGGCSWVGSNTVAPGRVRVLGNDETVVGGPDTETAARVADRLTDAGLDTTAVEDPEPYIWDKQFMNVAIKPVASLSELRNGPMIEYEDTRAVMRRLIEETMAVARATGVEILSPDPVADVIDRELDEASRRKKSSILEDVENERPTEIRHINGAVADIGDEVGVETPYNRMATQLVAGKERSYLD